MYDECPLEYRNSVRQAQCENMTYSQVCCKNSFDSDKENNFDKGTNNSMSFNMNIASVNTKHNSQRTNAMIVSKLRGILPYFISKDEKSDIYNIILQEGNNVYCRNIKELYKKEVL